MHLEIVSASDFEYALTLQGLGLQSLELSFGVLDLNLRAQSGKAGRSDFCVFLIVLTPPTSSTGRALRSHEDSHRLP